MNKVYKVVELWSDEADPRFRLQSTLHSLQPGDILTFVGKALGYAVFRSPLGKTVYLPHKTAFKIMTNQEPS